MRRLAPELGRFAVVGVGGLAAYLAVFALLHPIGAQPASLAARLLVALPTSWLNARFTFRSDVATGRAYAAGLGGLALGAAIAAATLAALHAVDAHPSRAVELTALAVAQLGAAAVRFVLLRGVATPSTTASARDRGRIARAQTFSTTSGQRPVVARPEAPTPPPTLEPTGAHA